MRQFLIDFGEKQMWKAQELTQKGRCSLAIYASPF